MKHTKEEIIKIITENQAGISVPELGRKYNIPSSTIHSWIQQAGLHANKGGLNFDYIKSQLKRIDRKRKFLWKNKDEIFKEKDEEKMNEDSERVKNIKLQYVQ